MTMLQAVPWELLGKVAALNIVSINSMSEVCGI